MAADLDRAYVINGDDLRIALLDLAGKTITPGDAAAAILAEHARPLREPHPTGPRTRDADLCARCGNQFKPGQVCDSCREVAAGPWEVRVVGHAHLCADDCPDDPELHAMAALLPALPLVSKLSHDARARVMDWATRRACDRLPPF